MTTIRPVRSDIAHDVVARERISSLDGYRAVAALLVVATHVGFATGFVTSGALGHLVSRFDWGVTIFFLLSGFLLYRPWARAAMTGLPTPRVIPYLWRRGLRILPAYWALVVVVLLLLPVALHPRDATTWLTYLLLGQTYSPRSLVEGLTHTWSLGAEVSFYVALPVLAWWATRRHRGDPDDSMRGQLHVLTGLALAGLVFTVLRSYGVLADLRWGFWLPSFLDWFALGMAGAVLAERRLVSVPGRRVRNVLSLANDTTTCLVAAAALMVLAATPVAGSYTLEQSPPWTSVARHVLYGLAAAVFLAPGALGLRPDAWHRGLTSRPMRALGRWSYGIFLWHLAIMWVVIDVTHLTLFSGGFWWLYAAVVVATIPMAALSWRWVEKPASGLRGRGPGREH
jgi:peptidoglycan/LPS O-acetylase OafA/YrhL